MGWLTLYPNLFKSYLHYQTSSVAPGDTGNENSLIWIAQSCFLQVRNASRADFNFIASL